MGSSLLSDARVPASVSEFSLPSLPVFLGTTAGVGYWQVRCVLVDGWVSMGESVQVLGVGGCESASELSPENLCPQRHMDAG